MTVHFIGFLMRLLNRSGQTVKGSSQPGRVDPPGTACTGGFDAVCRVTGKDLYIVRVCGCLDVHSYRDLMEEMGRAHRRGARNVVVDLRNVRWISLSGQYALHALAALFRGQQIPGPDRGIRALRELADANLNRGRSRRIKLVCGDPVIVANLKRTGMSQVFEFFGNTDKALRSFRFVDGLVA